MNIVKADMTTCKVIYEPFPEEKILGGRAMIDHLLTEYGLPTAHPLSEESIFVAAPGIFAGTNAPSSGRLSVGGKSPLTGGIKEANVGGTAGHMLGRLGINAIMVKGKTTEWKILKITAQGATLDNAGEVKGMNTYDACDKLRKRYGDKIGIILIGPAGEMKMANSSVAVTDPEGRPSRHAARGGVGAIMGAKGLKAIVIDDKGAPLRKGVNQGAFKEAVKAATEAVRTGDYTEALHTLSSHIFMDADNERGSLPTNNWRIGSFEKVENISSSKYAETVKARGGLMGHGCQPGCPIRCSSVYNDESGNFMSSGVEYESVAMLGPNLGIGDLDAIVRIERRCDELGLDTIELGGTIGILNDVGLFEFGDVARANALIDEIANGTSLGKILGNGVSVTASVFGIDRIPAVKRQAIPAHAARSSKGWGVTYATSPQGADHTAGPVLDEPLAKDGQGLRSQGAQILIAGLDATGLCLYTFLFGAPELIVSMINGLYGVNWTAEDFMNFGKNILRQEKDFNLKAGISDKDMLPDWLRKEPLPPTNAVFDVPQEDIDSVWNF